MNQTKHGGGEAYDQGAQQTYGVSKRKHQHAPKGNVVWKQTAEEATLANKPYINAYACGHGVQGDTKYNRTKEKRTWKRDLQEGASRGSFLFLAKLSFS